MVKKNINSKSYINIKRKKNGVEYNEAINKNVTRKIK